jgi:hypothetical protein
MSASNRELRVASRNNRSGRASSSSSSSLAPRTEIVKLVALGSDGAPWIADPRSASRRCRARTVVALGPSAVGAEVLVCLAGARRQPVILGVLREPSVDADVAAGEEAAGEAALLDVTVNRRRMTVSCDEELVFRCGKSRVELRPDGKILIQGVDVVSSASRTNRIRGGAVRIN